MAGTDESAPATAFRRPCARWLEPPAEFGSNKLLGPAVAGDGEGGAGADVHPVANHESEAGSETKDGVTGPLGRGFARGQNIGAGEVAIDDRPCDEFHRA